MSYWKPIETCPEDTWVLIIIPHKDGAYVGVSLLRNKNLQIWSGEIDDFLDTPTHWMELPDPPILTGEDDE